jgi:transposase
MHHIDGLSRNQLTLFPEALDDYISQENPVRFIDAYVDSLDLQQLGFRHAVLQETGRPPYYPGDLLKLYLYGYLNRVRSSRQLEREAQRNVEVMWLLRRLAPDFKTIADFRRDNRQAIRNVSREFTLFCRQLDLFSGDLVATPALAAQVQVSTAVSSRRSTAGGRTSPRSSSNEPSKSWTTTSIAIWMRWTKPMKKNQKRRSSLLKNFKRRSKR